MNIENLHNELTSLSIPISGCDSEGNVNLLMSRNKVIQIDNGDGTFGSQTLDEPSEEFVRANLLISMVLNAHGKALTSAECLALQQECSEAEWLAFTECRKNPIRQQRAALYSQTTDALFMAAMEESTTLFDAVEQVYNVKVDKPKWDEWLAEKENIRTNNPYPE